MTGNNESLSSRCGLLFGYGSIGRRHARALAEHAQHLVIVEPKEPARAQAREAHPTAVVLDSTEALEEQRLSWREVMAVIATWGPSHASVFHWLADHGVRRILCEKPMASSVRDAWAMADRARREGIVLATHHYLRYARLAPGLRTVAAEHDLGEPVAVRVDGGAACLVTNGLHWLDFVIDLFGASPESVTSTAAGEGINPRSPELQLYGGTAIWRFPNDREAVISFSNRASLAPSARVVFRHAMVDIDDELHAVVRRRDPAVTSQLPALTRTGMPQQVLFQGALPGSIHHLQGLQSAIREVWCGQPLTTTGETGAIAVGSIIGALLAAREGRMIGLPIAPDSQEGGERWPIS
jgi:predicted dehydrogenase